MSGAPILFVDRDGTLIEEPSDFQVDSLEKIRLLPDVIAPLLELKAAGYHFVMVTNQDGLGAERYPQQHFDQVQQFVLRLFGSQGIEFDRIFVCPHFQHEGCACRKPLTGLVTDYLKGIQLDRAHSAMVGDRDTDLQFAHNLGIRGFRVRPPQESWPCSPGAPACSAGPAKPTLRPRSNSTAALPVRFTPASASSITCSSNWPSMAAFSSSCAVAAICTSMSTTRSRTVP
jgi:histidinol-phosphatase